jgi:predicted amidophosphoribosyltransferase
MKKSKTVEATYRLCPHCLRAVPSASGEHFCSNDGQRLLEACPGCARTITSPFARFCTGCGLEFRSAAHAPNDAPAREARLETNP